MTTSARVHPEHLKPQNSDEVMISVSVEHHVSQSGWIDDEPQQEALCPDLQHTGAVSQELRARRAQLGMGSGAVDGWTQYHNSPVVAMTYHFLGHLVVLVTVGYLVTGAPLSRYYYSSPLLFATLMHIWHFAIVWRTGPNVTKNTLINGSLPGMPPSCCV